MKPAGEPASRFPRLARVALGLALVAGATLVIVFALRLLMRTGEAGGRTLGSLSPLMSVLIAVGGAVTGFVGSKAPLVEGAGLLFGVVGAVLVAVSVRGPRPAGAAGSGLLLLAAILLFPRHPVVCGVFGLAAGLALAWRAADTPREPDPPAARFLVLVPVGAAALMRLWALGEVPAGFSGHAVFHHVVKALPYFDLVKERWASGGVLAVPGLLFDTLGSEAFAENSFVSAVGYLLLGINFTAARLVSAVLGALSVYVAYRAGAALSGRRLGLVFSCLLALSPWHVQISRYGDSEHVLSPLQFLLSLWLLLEALDRGRLFHYLCAALALGLGWFVYSPNQAGLLLMAVFALYKVAAWPKVLARDSWKIALAAALLLFVSIAPLRSLAKSGRIVPNFRTGYDAETVSLRDTARARTMLLAAGKHLFFAVDDNWFMKPGGGLGSLEAALLVPGLVLSVRWLLLKRRRDLAVLVLAGIPVTLLPGVLAPDESFRRFFLTATLMLLLGAAVLDEWSGLARAAGAGRRALSWLGAAAGALFLCIATFTYFRKVYVESEETSRFPFEMAKIARASLGKEFVMIVRSYSDEETARYVLFGAHDELARLAARGLGPEQLFSLETCAGAFSRLDSLPRIGGRCRLLVEQDIFRHARQSCGERDLVAEIGKRFPAAVRSEVRDARGDVLTSWLIE